VEVTIVSGDGAGDATEPIVGTERGAPVKQLTVVAASNSPASPLPPPPVGDAAVALFAFTGNPLNHQLRCDTHAILWSSTFGMFRT
jgi:hypothetical protein